jgi:hypothetical protein
VLDELPEGEGEAVVLVLTGRQLPARRDHGEAAARYPARSRSRASHCSAGLRTSAVVVATRATTGDGTR